MNEIGNKFLLAGDKFIPEMHLKQRGLSYSTCGTFTRNKERIQKFKETGYTSYIYKNELDKACFQHDMAYGAFKDLARRIIRMVNIRELASMVYKFFDKKPKGSDVTALTNKSAVNTGLDSRKQLAEELHKPIARKF